MNEKKSKQIKFLSGILIGILVIAVLIRILYLNCLYPSPKVVTYNNNETIKIGNYEINEIDWEWGDGKLLKDKCPDYIYMEMEDGKEYPLDKERAGLITLSVTKVMNDTTTLDLTGISFEADGYGNQFDMELFYKLNPKFESLLVNLKANETISFVMPVTMNDGWFSEKEWKNIDDKKIYMVFQYYPEKIKLCCN